MGLDERPSSRDIVLYKSLPNEMPRVAGIITAVRQTPLSHVNLRAIQDKVPNAFVAGAAEDKVITELVGKYVFYKVTSQRYEVREATGEEVDAHFEKIRPAETQVPNRDLTVKGIRSLDDVKFEDSGSIGIKAANVATMRTFEFADGTVPAGYAIPFYFYDEFMKHHGFYEKAGELLADEDFKTSRDKQEKALKKFRKTIKSASVPDWMSKALSDLQKSFPAGTPIRCRSSTNNEDLPGFSGAGLYESYTHKPDEGHLAKTIKQVFASMWNFRAYEEREFHRIDHMAAAMGVLVHPNFKGEKANGVAVTTDILYQTEGNYYVNSQVGEDLITNPENESVPEESLLDWWDSSKSKVMQVSNRVEGGGQILSKEHLDQLSKCLARIHGRFAKLYKADPDGEKFAMEIEFKIDSDGKLVIKQARPWVF